MDSIFPVCFLPLSGLVRSGLFRGVERMKGWSGNYGGKNYGSMRIVGRDMRDMRIVGNERFNVRD